MSTIAWALVGLLFVYSVWVLGHDLHPKHTPRCRVCRNKATEVDDEGFRCGPCGGYLAEGVPEDQVMAQRATYPS